MGLIITPFFRVPTEVNEVYKHIFYILDETIALFY